MSWPMRKMSPTLWDNIRFSGYIRNSCTPCWIICHSELIGKFHDFRRAFLRPFCIELICIAEFSVPSRYVLSNLLLLSHLHFSLGRCGSILNWESYFKLCKALETTRVLRSILPSK